MSTKIKNPVAVAVDFLILDFDRCRGRISSFEFWFKLKNGSSQHYKSKIQKSTAIAVDFWTLSFDFN